MTDNHNDKMTRTCQTTEFPVMYSMLATDALCAFVQERYRIGQVTNCKLLHRGLNDTYIAVTDNDRYILRVYRAAWRTRTEVDYELEVVNYLSEQGVSVAFPIRNKDGEFVTEVHAPEGMRCTALFTYANGTRPRLDVSTSCEYGKTVARIHRLTDTFVSSRKRFELDFHHLLDEPLEAFAPAMLQYGGDIGYVQSFARAIREHVSHDDLESGFCHGDLHDWNAHWNGQRLTIFDFDCCGQGYRAYDLAVFLWNLKTNYRGKESDNWASFLDGYRSLRPITEDALHAIPWFVAARRIWLAGIYLSNEDVWGTGIINEGFFRSFVDQLKDDEKELGVRIASF